MSHLGPLQGDAGLESSVSLTERRDDLLILERVRDRGHPQIESKSESWTGLVAAGAVVRSSPK